MSELRPIPKYQFIISGGLAAGFFVLTRENIHDRLYGDHPVPGREGLLNGPIFGDIPGLLTAIMITSVMLSIVMSPIFLRRFSLVKRGVFVIIAIVSFLALLFAPEMLEGRL